MNMQSKSVYFQANEVSPVEKHLYWFSDDYVYSFKSIALL